MTDGRPPIKWTAWAGALVALVLMGPAGASDAPPDLLWPMPVRPAVSSNFCEHRPGHLHAGLDIRTFGREGVECLSGGPGYVSRVRASANGYGKAVYLQLHSGETLVFAHLAEFTPALERVVRDAQERSRRYRVDMRFPPGRFPVERGDVVGYSGMTGATAPHLHFEVRNEQEHPMDPFSSGFSLDDAMAPEFESVRLLPLDVATRIDGACFPAELSARRVSAGAWVIDDTVTVSGPTGVSVEVLDRLNGESGRLAPHAIELSVDGIDRASVAFESFSFGHTSQVDFVYEIERIRSRKQYYFQLFARAGETLWNREFAGEGRIGGEVGGEVHSATITARDRAGNEATLVFAYRSGDGRSDRPASAAGGELEGVHFYEGLMAVHPAAPFPLDRWSSALGASGVGGGLVITAAELGGVPVALPADASGHIYVAGAVPGEGRTIRFDELDLEVEIGDGTLYSDQVVYATRWLPGVATAKPGELAGRTRRVRVGPYAMSLRADMTIRFTGIAADSSDAIYRLNERKGEWVYYESTVTNNDVSTTAKRPGVYAVLRDQRGPRIGAPALRTRERYADGSPVAELVVPIEDAGSDVDAEKVEISVDGQGQITRWDFVARKMFIEMTDPNILGPQTVIVTAYDQIGNVSRLEATVEFP